ncbi:MULTISPECIES: nitroreductase family protein [unclassified Novosphingobium]|uniref:nitroreductase family protein n=1 Tax=unclassified Novosphingobium TaxID=2644732 RepID=UPI0014477DDA|nr:MULTISPECIES: nitroreductase family protein [unclassified Novosphingobium]MDR6708626.1 nitroreductase [Novosphingobium sp. 1748]NKI97967.1 nitroreductase [Novosphingobium sp. SG707]
MTTRNADHPIDPDFLARWSPRAYSEQGVTQADLLPLFEAARWAPSAFNYQPWRFAYALRGDANWDAFVGALLPFNAGWAQKAGALIFVLSDKQITAPGASEATPAKWNSFDAGAAWAYLALQGAKRGLSTHAMAGFDPEAAAKATGAGERYKVEVAVAVGWRGDAGDLPEALQAREKPSPRLSVNEIAFHGPLQG